MLYPKQKNSENETQAFCSIVDSRLLTTRVLLVAPITLIITQQKTRTICNPILITIFSCLEKSIKANQIARMRDAIISLDERSSLGLGCNGEAKLSREHF